MNEGLAGEPKNESSEMKIKEKPTHRSEQAARLVLNWFLHTAKRTPKRRGIQIQLQKQSKIKIGIEKQTLHSQAGDEARTEMDA
jgi:hypothetical protein